MSLHKPIKVLRPRHISIDLLADWRPYAAPLPEPRSPYCWRYYGTVTVGGRTGALAWRAGSFGIGLGEDVCLLGLNDRVKIDMLLLVGPPGLDGIPHFAHLAKAQEPDHADRAGLHSMA